MISFTIHYLLKNPGRSMLLNPAPEHISLTLINFALAALYYEELSRGAIDGLGTGHRRIGGMSDSFKNIFFLFIFTPADSSHFRPHSPRSSLPLCGAHGLPFSYSKFDCLSQKYATH